MWVFLWHQFCVRKSSKKNIDHKIRIKSKLLFQLDIKTSIERRHSITSIKYFVQHSFYDRLSGRIGFWWTSLVCEKLFMHLPKYAKFILSKIYWLLNFTNNYIFLQWKIIFKKYSTKMHTSNKYRHIAVKPFQKCYYTTMFYLLCTKCSWCSIWLNTLLYLLSDSHNIDNV